MNKLNDKLLNDLVETNLNALRMMYDTHIHTEFKDTDAEGNEVNNSLQSFVYQMNGIIPSLYNQVTYADKMLNYAENGLKWEKDKQGASSRIASLDMYARSQEISSVKLSQLEQQYNAREHNFNHAYARMIAYTKYFKEVTGDEYVPFTSKGAKPVSEETKKKVKVLEGKEKKKLAAFYNKNINKIAKVLDNEDGTISPELIPAQI
jgi:hypothetical protein